MPSGLRFFDGETCCSIFCSGGVVVEVLFAGRCAGGRVGRPVWPLIASSPAHGFLYAGELL